VLNPEISLNRRPADRIARNAVLARIAELWQPVILRVRDAGGAPLKHILNGTFMGHPLHAALTDIPIGAWTVTAALDMLDTIGAGDLGDAADISLSVGVLGALGAIATGYADWADTAGDPRTLGVAHSSLMGAAFFAYCTALALRRSGNRPAGVACALAGYALVLAGAYLGGELSLGYQLGVKHTAVPKEPPADFVRVAALDELVEGKMTRVEVDGLPILLLRQGLDVRAVAGACTHRGAPLDEGTLEAGACVRCPWHGSVFSFDDGGVLEGPATFPLARFETRVLLGDVQLRALTP
jgi:nitrite reductase/ring-hydroxylating ferredoxin subunit/uncharacterized membrane protein